MKPNITNNKKANFATKLLDSVNCLVPEVPLVENELNVLSPLIYILNK